MSYDKRKAPTRRRAPARAPAKRKPATKRSRARPSYYGQDVVRLASKGLPYGGALVGGYLGGPAGAIVGRGVGAIGRDLIKGFGDYNISKNVLLSGQTPHFGTSARPGGGTLINYREYIGDVISSSTANTFKIESFQMRPSELGTFPWLSQCAQNYQEWVPHGIIVEFKSNSGDALNSVNTALGSVILSSNYNSALANYASRAECENSEYANSIKPSENCMHPIECARSASVISNLYTKDADSSSDIRLSSLCRFQVASDGCQGTSVNLGSLYINYSIELLKPILSDAIGNDVSITWFTSTTGVVDGAPLGTAPELRNVSNQPIISPTSTVFTFPYSSVTKSYLISMSYWGDSTASIANPSRTPSGGASVVDDIWIGNNEALEQAVGGQGGVTGTALVALEAYQVLGGSHSAIVTYGTGGTLPTACSLDFKCIELPNSFITTTGFDSFLESQ